MPELLASGLAAEESGFEALWTSEFERSPFVPLTALAQTTNIITLGTAIALAFVRSPMTTALTALDLAELAGPRLVLGLGTGVKRLNEDWHNARFGKPVAHLRETVEIIRRFWRDAHTEQAVEYEGEYERIRVRGYRRRHPAPIEPIPIYLAGVGPAATRLAAEIGDGWIGLELGSPAFLRAKILPSIEDGLRASGRRREDVTLIASACVCVNSDGRAARRQMAG